MDSKSFGKHLKYKLRELELIIGNIEKEGKPARIDIDLALSKTRELYEILLNSDPDRFSVAAQKFAADTGEKPVVPPDPEPVDSEEEFEQDGIIPGAVHKQTETTGSVASPESNEPDSGAASESNGAGDEPEDDKKEKAGQLRKEKAENIFEDQGKEPVPPADDKKHENSKPGSPDQPEEKTKNTGKQNGQKEIVADRFQDAHNYINKAMAEKKSGKDLTSKMQTRPITDLRNSIGLNEKFLFIKELFKGRPDQYNHCIDMLNKASTYEEAMKFIKDNYDWEEEDDEVAEKLINLVKRKYPAG